MNKRIQGSLFLLFLASAIFASPASQAVDFKGMPSRIITFVKNCFTREHVKTAALRTTRALWCIAKVGAIATVLGNIFMPERLRQYLVKQPGIGRFIFKRKSRQVAPDVPAELMPRAVQTNPVQLPTAAQGGTDVRYGLIQERMDRLGERFDLFEKRLGKVDDLGRVMCSAQKFLEKTGN